MPITLSQLAPFIAQPVQPRYYGGIARLGESVREDSRLDMAAEQQRAELERRKAEDAMQNQRALAHQELQKQQLGIGLGQLDIQRSRLQQEAEKQRGLDLQKAQSEYVAAVSSQPQDPAKIQLARNRLRELGVEVEVGQQQQAPASTGGDQAPGPAPQSMPEPPPAAQGPGELGALGPLLPKASGALRGMLGLRPRSPSVEELMLSPGDKLLEPGQPTAPVPQEQRIAPGVSGGMRPAPQAPVGLAPGAHRLKRGDEELLVIEPEKAIEAKRQLLSRAMAPVVAQARGPEAQRAAKIAMDTALALIDQGANPEDAFKEGMKRYEYEVSEYGKLQRSQISGGARVAAAQREFGGSGQTKDERAVVGDNADRVEKKIQNAKQEFGYNALAKMETETAKIIGATKANSGFGDVQAIVASITSLQQRATDADFRAAVAAGGLESKVKNLFGFTFEEGRFDKRYMEQVRKTAEQIARAASETRRSRADDTAADVEEMGAALGWSDEEIKRWRDYAFNNMVRGSAPRRQVQRRTAAAQKQEAPAQRSPEEKKKRARELLGGGL